MTVQSMSEYSAFSSGFQSTHPCRSARVQSCAGPALADVLGCDVLGPRAN